tara:strand:- start:1007 stop:1870 length:864 start_codon:yes stop_codon:yes gene_type:complete
MDKVLTRKLFRKRYFQSNPPKKFNNGGLSSLEKGIIAASFAAPLLKSTRSPGQSSISATAQALGTGFEKLPETLLAIQKNRPTVGETIRQATDAEKRNLGFDIEDNVNVKVKGGNVIGIASKPTAGERDKAADRKDALRSINAIQDGLKETRTGPISGRLAKTRAYLGFDNDAAKLQIEIGNFRKSIIKALRGAQVGPAEERSFDEILPFMSDPPSVIKAKMDVAKEKLETIEARLNPNGQVAERLSAEEVAAQDRKIFEKFGVAFNLNETFDASVPTYDLQGNLVE